MELYKWHKGTELPDKNCDCIIVRKNNLFIAHYTAHNYYRNPGFYQQYPANDTEEIVPPAQVCAWLAFKYPKEFIESSKEGAE